jgi:hypothetical protein
MTSLTRPPREDRLEINPAIREVIELTRGVKNDVSVQAAPSFNSRYRPSRSLDHLFGIVGAGARAAPIC